MSTSLDHLTKNARAALALPQTERIEFVRRERWIGYPKAKEALNKLEELRTYPKSHRMPNLLLVGDTNNGKTTIINRFGQLHPASDNPDGEVISYPVLIVQAPPVPDEGRFYNAILKTLSAPFKERDKPDKKLFQILTILDGVGLRVLIIDELHNIIAGSTRLQRVFLNVVRYLGNELKVPIVGGGIQEAFHAIQSDPQLANRFEPLFLPRWKIDDNSKPEEDVYLKLLSSFEALLPLNEPSRLTEPTLALKILSMSDGLIGEISTLLRRAAVEAIVTGKERIDAKLLDRIKWVPPTKRKWPTGMGVASAQATGA
jgi:hypothetical protein